MNVAIVGTGYVGLVTGACLADFGNRVTCVDADAAKIDRLRNLELPFFEPGLPELVQVVFITVGTPPRADGSADTSAIYAVAKVVAQNLDGYRLVVQKSTAPV